ncbi:MAG TPA: nucleoside monophosphate kinase, partial [Pyrinomonadaceae bacterium]|nr:nucleoside monophosphate kinase [Pyrinomonadaceae bacterium]
ISTGDIFRALSQTRSPLAEEVRALQQAGRLIPDDVVIRVVEDRTSQADCDNGYVLDGFPRTAAQAEMLEGLATRQGKSLSAILIEVPVERLEKRMTGRRSCPVCGEIYNVYFRAPKNDSRCDLHPDAELIHRADDDEEKVRVRLETFNRETAPVLEYYQQTGRLQRVDGMQDPERIYSAIEQIVNGEQIAGAV